MFSPLAHCTAPRAIQEASAAGIKVAAAKRVLKLMHSLEAAISSTSSSGGGSSTSSSGAASQAAVLRSRIEAAEAGGVPNCALIDTATHLLRRLSLLDVHETLEVALRPHADWSAVQRLDALQAALAKAEAAGVLTSCLSRCSSDGSCRSMLQAVASHGQQRQNSSPSPLPDHPAAVVTHLETRTCDGPVVDTVRTGAGCQKDCEQPDCSTDQHIGRAQTDRSLQTSSSSSASSSVRNKPIKQSSKLRRSHDGGVGSTLASELANSDPSTAGPKDLKAHAISMRSSTSDAEAQEEELLPASRVRHPLTPTSSTDLGIAEEQGTVHVDTAHVLSVQWMFALCTLLLERPDV